MEDEVCRVIESALDLDSGSVTLEDSMSTIGRWDSLGFLAILSALEQRFGNRVAGVNDLARAKSVRDIVAILKRESII